jgi:thiamine-monophosphate kinase
MELEFIDWLRKRLPPHPRLLLGPGDDAALIEMAKSAACLVTVDLVCDGVDFDLATIDPARVGRKALAVNLSDIAAMAGRPLAAVVALLLPRRGALELAKKLYEGMLPLAEKYGVAIAGGDVNTWDNPLAVSVTLLGEPGPRGPLKRSGAKPGDRILVTGELGGSILAKHLDFEPRVNEALLLRDRYTLHAGIDISDGLALDLSRVCAESGCGAAVETPKVPISEDARRLAAQLADGSTALDHALSDGEDFELLLAVPPGDVAKIAREQPLAVRISDIGQFVPERGLWQTDNRGQHTPLAPRGYLHKET